MRHQVFIPLPEPLAELYFKLLTANLMTRMAQRIVEKKLPKYYDHNGQLGMM